MFPYEMDAEKLEEKPYSNVFGAIFYVLLGS